MPDALSTACPSLTSDSPSSTDGTAATTISGVAWIRDDQVQ